jgi:hypothetical protein
MKTKAAPHEESRFFHGDIFARRCYLLGSGVMRKYGRTAL